MFPAIGDWVAVELREEEKFARICHILPRKTKFSRKVILSATDEQVIETCYDFGKSHTDSCVKATDADNSPESKSETYSFAVVFSDTTVRLK